MKPFQFKSLLPHVIAVLIFLFVTIIFCKPGLESNVVLNQSDGTAWFGMSHQSMEYKKEHGHIPLWNTNMFCGMPNYQIAMEGKWSPFSLIDSIFQLGLPQPFNFFYLACICFYFLCICLGIRPFAAIIGSIAFAFSTYSPIIITAGHVSKMMALAYSPALIGSVILIFNRKYWLGFILTAIFTALQIGQSHQQISYYLFIVLMIMTISYFIQYLKLKELSHFSKSVGLILIAGIIGVACNALSLMTSLDYSKESKRGGQLVMNANEKSFSNSELKDGKTVGLSKDYAFMWSYGKAETWTLMFPGVLGYGSHQAERDGEYYVFPKIKDNGPLVNYLNENLPQFPADQIANQMNGAIYWGSQPFTNGPIYLGAIVCFLFIFGLFYLDGKHKWWILTTCVLSILLSWGDNFKDFNYFIFDHFPLYNKFRVPTMILVIPQLLFPIMASLVVDKLISDETRSGWKSFKYAGISTLIIFSLISIFYFSSDFSKENKARTTEFNSIIKSGSPDIQNKLQQLDEKYKPSIDNQIYEGMFSNISRDPNITDPTRATREFVSALKKERASFLLNDIIRSLILVLLAGVLIALYLKGKINSIIMIIGLTLFCSFDLLQFGMNYLNDKSFDYKESHEESQFPMSNADKQILLDKDPNYRVFNSTTGLDECKTSYYHRSIGGYHPAKLGIYDDLIANQFKGNINMSVLNMLNTKYIIQQQGNDKVAQLNTGALGNVWFVKAANFVKGPVNEMRAITNFNPKDTAIIDESYKSLVSAFTAPDSSENIKMTAFDNDTISYESNTKSNHVAIFSEMYYKDWKVYIDNKPSEYFKANYVLRGMMIPAGNHKIVFIFEPKSYYQGVQISSISSWLLTLLFIGIISMLLLKKKKEQTN